VAKNIVPASGGEACYRAKYLVFERSSDHQKSGVDNVIGLVGVLPAKTYGVPYPDHLTLSDEVASARSILKLEMGYMFLPHSWGKGYCTEAVRSILQAYKSASNFWKPYRGVYVLCIMSEDNPASVQVAKKSGFEYLGLHRWKGEHVFVGGAMRPPEVKVCGMLLVSPEDREI
jgi:hypothetical protein